MAWSAAGVQTGTDTDLSGLTAVTGTTTTTVGNVTVYTVTSVLTIQGTLTMDPMTELLIQTSTANNSVNVTTGTFIIGAEVASDTGHNRVLMTPLQTAIIFAKEGPGCCNNGPFTIGASGALEIYGAAINLSGCFDVDGAVKIRNAIFFSHGTAESPNNTRWRSNAAPADYDIDGLITYGIQFDSLVDGTFGNFVNFLPLDKGIPIENATGTAGAVRAWRAMPDNTFAAGSLMNNWQGAKDVQIYLSEPGSRTVVVPDSVSASFSHGGRLYHEFTILCRDVLNAPIDGALTHLTDYDNGDRVTTTTAGGSISQGDQTLVEETGLGSPYVPGQTPLQTLMTAMYYRTNTVGDLRNPDGLERTDCRAKPYSVNAAISGSSGVSGTFSSSDSSLPNLSLGDRFVLNGSTSNDTQVWETTEDWTGGNGGDADRLSSNSTNESENAMDLVVLGEDHYDIHVWAYEYLPFKFTDAAMKGLTQLDLVATLLEDSAVTETNRSTVQGYLGIGNLERFYDSAKDFKVTEANLETPAIDEPLVYAEGDVLNLGAQNLILDGSNGTPFAHAGSTFTINPASFPEITIVGSTEAVSSGEDDEISIAFPGGIADNDVAYIAVGHAQSEENTWNTPSGWVIPTGLTEVRVGQESPDILSIPGVTIFRRVLSGDSGSVNITNVGTNVSGIVAQMIVFRDVDTTTPEDVNPVTASGLTGDPNPGSITPANELAMIVAFGFMDDGDQALIGSPSVPSGYTLQEETATPDGAGGGD